MRLVLFLVMSMLGLACSLSRVSRNAALRRRVEPRALLAVGWKPSPAPLQLQKVIDWVSPPAGEKTLDEQTHKAYAGLKRAVSNAIVTNWHRKSMLQDLVRFGDAWVAMHNIEHVRIPKLVENQNFHMVEGCTSAVAIGIIHHERQSHCSVIGKSDSRVIQGLLAVICDILSTYSEEEIVLANKEQLVSDLRINKILPPGRLDGMLNVISTIQDLVVKASYSRPQVEPAQAQPSKLVLAEIASQASVPETIVSELPRDELRKRKEEVAMLLSGGVDSAVALKLLVDQGFKVRAYYLKIWLEEGLQDLADCPWETDIKYAKETCQQLGVPLEVLSMQDEYRDQVIRYTVAESRKGMTPNPDIMCNSLIKFGAFYNVIGRYHKKIATGHYARLVSFKDAAGVERYQLAPAPDPVKDQSYFLANLSPKQLSHAMFPLAGLLKSEVRLLAEKFGLPPKHRKDSQGLCFLGKLSFDDFIRHYLGENPGDILDATTKEKLGVHRGLWFHTIGQRKGIVPLLKKNCHAGPFYVADKHVKSNTLFVTNQPELLLEPRRRFFVEKIRWQSSIPEDLLQRKPLRVMVKLRHGTTVTPATIRFRSRTSKELKFELEEADAMGIAPGQFAVVYDKDFTHVLAAGVTKYQNLFSPARRLRPKKK